MILSVTVVGCGAVAQRLYRKPLQTLERQGLLRVTGLIDTHLAHAKAMSSFFPHASIGDDLEDASAANGCELILVLSPAHLHADHTILALQRDYHVLCEKPMATTQEECGRMIAAACAADRVLAIAMVRRFFPSFAQLRQLILSEDLGRIEMFEYREGRRFDWDVTTPAGFRQRSDGGTGVLLDIGPHAIDLLSWIFGIPKIVSYADDALAGVESNVVMELRSSICSGSLQISWDFPLANELRVFGSRGQAVLRIDQFDKLAIKTTSHFQEIEIDYCYPADKRQPSRWQVSPRHYTQAIYCQLIQVIRAIELGESPAVSGEVGKECISLMETARGVAQPLSMPWLPPKQQEAYRDLHWTSAKWTQSRSSEPAVMSAPVS